MRVMTVFIQEANTQRSNHDIGESEERATNPLAELLAHHEHLGHQLNSAY
jgi:hypothetical protein